MLSLNIDLVILYLFALSIRFFLFEFYLFEKTRKYLKSFNNYYINKLLKCCFCQGFWCGTASYFFLIDWNLIYITIFGFSTAILTYYVKASTYKSCNYMEKQEKYDN
jgi:hypothetical protein